ncbi:MAG: CpsD/CapB family tyrosine-protein kinase [Lachnospiraceae bacterium]|nr:CpsD/CapB family tyrosine-protein kinase [Lachnospiraceae bacterium]
MQKIKFEKLGELDQRSNESYKTLRTNIQFCGSEVKTILVTSTTQNEGKSSVSFNLARSFAENGNRVILVDADLRKSVLAGRYGVSDTSVGLSYYLSGQKEMDEIVNATNIPNMDIIFAGKVPPNPSELLGSDAFKKLLDTLRNQYDYVIIDTPPLGYVIDSAVVAPNCDGTIMVIENNAISYRAAQEVMEQLERVNSRILGVVLNKVVLQKKDKYYSHYYTRYGEETKKSQKKNKQLTNIDKEKKEVEEVWNMIR